MQKRHLRLVHTDAQVAASVRKKKTATTERRFQTDYAGAWPGHCKTRESALMAACKHIISDNYVRATITDKHTGETVARVRVSADRKRAIIETVKPFKKV